eukprot:jgi/Bigna1/72847/fgenesh1_pg.21_\
MSSETPLNLIIPLGGVGSRFQKEGFMQPKPFVRVLGQGMVEWLVETLRGVKPCDSLVIIYNPRFLTMENNMLRLAEKLKAKFASVKLVRLPGPTKGAAETVLYGVKELSSTELKNPCMLLDGDCFYHVNIVSKFREFAAEYVKVTDEKSWNITEIIEKVKISNYANTGCYCFRNASELREYIEAIMKRGEMQLSQDQKGEYYTSGVIKTMLKDKIPFKAILVDRSDFFVLGPRRGQTEKLRGELREQEKK